MKEHIFDAAGACAMLVSPPDKTLIYTIPRWLMDTPVDTLKAGMQWVRGRSHHYMCIDAQMDLTIGTMRARSIQLRQYMAEHGSIAPTLDR